MLEAMPDDPKDGLQIIFLSLSNASFCDSGFWAWLGWPQKSPGWRFSGIPVLPKKMTVFFLFCQVFPCNIQFFFHLSGGKRTKPGIHAWEKWEFTKEKVHAYNVWGNYARKRWDLICLAIRRARNHLAVSKIFDQRKWIFSLNNWSDTQCKCVASGINSSVLTRFPVPDALNGQQKCRRECNSFETAKILSDFKTNNSDS